MLKNEMDYFSVSTEVELKVLVAAVSIVDVGK